MPPIGYLLRMWGTFTGSTRILGGTVAADHLDSWMALEPVNQCLCRPLCEQIHGTMGFQVDEDGAIGAAPPERKVIHPQDFRGLDCCCSPLFGQPQQGIGTHRHADLVEQ